MTAGGPTPYDAFPYVSYPYFETHPDQLRLVGHLFGMQPAPVDRCRVLEIGCAGGGNLIPIAELHPDSSFLGIDLAATQIETGREVVATLGLRNIELRHQDLADLGRADGGFDYIIAHGVYSWLPEPVRARLLDVVAELLAPQGVALVSHNVKPGWYPRKIARDLMMWHVAGIEDPAERVEQGRAFLAFIVAAARPEEERHRSILQAELEHIRATPDFVVLHDYLEAVNDACYLQEFVAELPPRGLAFLGDAYLGSMIPHGYPPAVKQALDHMAVDLVAHEQLLDFLRNRAFRLTLVCRADLPLDRSLTVRKLSELQLSAQGQEGSDGIFRTPLGSHFQPAGEPTRRALRRLCDAWPRSLPYAEVGGDAELLEALGAGLLWPSLTAARCGPAGDRPRATPHARLCAARGRYVTNLRHQNVSLTPDARLVLEMLDGSRDRDALRRATVLPVDALLDDLAAKGLLIQPSH